MRTRLGTVWTFISARLHGAAGAVLLLAVCCLAGCERGGAPAARTDEGAAASLFEGVELRDQEGKALPPGAWRGQLLVLNFMFTSCPAVCPRQTRELVELRREMPEELRQRVRFLSLSVDPENDDPAALLAFARANGADAPGWTFATAGIRGTPPLTARLGAFDPSQAQPRPADHKTSLYVFDTEGRLVQRYGGAPLDRRRLLRELEELDRLGRRSGSSLLGFSK